MSTRSSRHTPRSQKRPPPPPPCAASRLLRWSFRVQVPARVRHAQVPARGVMAFKMSTRNSRHTPRPQKSPPPLPCVAAFHAGMRGLCLPVRDSSERALQARGGAPLWCHHCYYAFVAAVLVAAGLVMAAVVILAVVMIYIVSSWLIARS